MNRLSNYSHLCKVTGCKAIIPCSKSGEVLYLNLTEYTEDYN